MRRPRGPERLFIALDCDHDQAAYVVAVTRGMGVGYKIGPVLLSHLPAFPQMGRVFLDLKLYDTTATIGGAVDVMARHGVVMTTVCAKEWMVEAAIRARGDRPNPLIIVVGSPSDRDAHEGNGRHMLGNWVSAGADGVVLSARDPKQVSQAGLIVMPGVRLPEDASGGHAATYTPQQAIANGADYCVVGRPIVDAKDPAQRTKDYLSALTDAR